MKKHQLENKEQNIIDQKKEIDEFRQINKNLEKEEREMIIQLEKLRMRKCEKVVNEFLETQNIEKIKYSIKHNSCKYAKKQYTYIKDIPGSKIIEYQATQDDIAKVKNEIIKFIENSL